MAKPGPAKGHGGRPRTSTPKARSDGYKRTSVGPKGKGKQQYEHRVVAYGGTTAGAKRAPKGTKGKGTVVHHRDHNRGNNSSSNLRRVSRSYNTAEGNRRRAGR